VVGESAGEKGTRGAAAALLNSLPGHVANAVEGSRPRVGVASPRKVLEEMEERTVALVAKSCRRQKAQSVLAHLSAKFIRSFDAGDKSACLHDRIDISTRMICMETVPHALSCSNGSVTPFPRARLI
jgi:hypothetical protein